MPSVEITSGINAGETHPVEARETTLGRHPDCNVVLRDSTVSRRHARITREGEAYYVDDLGSQHGTRLNGEPIRFPCRLNDGDEIQLSQVAIVFHDDRVTKDRPSTIISSLDMLTDAGLSEDPHTTPKWRALLEITRSLGVSLDLKTILPKVLENVSRILPQASRGCIMLAEGPSAALRAYAVRDVAGGTEVPSISRTITQHVMTEGRAILSSDAGEDERFQASESVLELQMRSVLCAPLIGASNNPLGMIHLDAQDPSRQFTSDDLDVLVNIANLVGQAVDHARLHETMLQYDRRERDLETARQVQMHFLPQGRPSIRGYDLFDYYNPAEAVGGDYFGYTPLPEEAWAIAVGDVAGHGIPAALLMARLCSEARYCLATNALPSDAVDVLNQQLTQQNLAFFITFEICVLDPSRHALTVVNAGHMPPLLRRAGSGRIEALGASVSSPPLGIDSSVRFQQISTTLEPGDVVVMYTDGVSEARSVAGEIYGVERIQAVLDRAADAPELIQSLLEDVQKFTQGKAQEDDVCVVAFSRKKD